MAYTGLTIEDLARLLSVLNELSSYRQLDGVAQLVRRAARDLTGADGVSFALREGEQVHYAEDDALGPLWKGRRVRASECLAGWSMLHRQTVEIEDIYAHGLMARPMYELTFVRSLLIVPVDRVAPVAAVGAYWATPRQPQPREITLLEALADAIAVALERGRSFDAAERARTRAEETAQRQQELLSIVSHDLRNPLSVISASASLLARLDTHHVETPQHLRRQSSVIQNSVRHMEALLRDLLDCAELRAGALDLRLESSDAKSLLESVEDLADLAAERRQCLQIDYPDQPLLVRADRERIAQVLGNLVGNALKFTPSGGTIHVSARRTSAVDGGEVTFRVSDTGSGIAPGDLERVFQPFVRGAQRGHQQGRGLGLWIAKRLVEAHLGRIWAENAARGGAVFQFTLPGTCELCP
jgi:signal transduction histidine kinase